MAGGDAQPDADTRACFDRRKGDAIVPVHRACDRRGKNSG